VSRNPILKPLETIENRDAVLNSDGTEAKWPEVNAIIGNPPFLGAKLMKGWLGVDYTDRLRNSFKGRLPGFSDLVCFWLEKVRGETLNGKCCRVGLVATSSVRGGTNRVVLDAIAEKLIVYEAWSELPWTIEGARVEVSIVCFAREADAPELRRLNGVTVECINADLTTGINLTAAKPLSENKHISFLGIQTSGPWTFLAILHATCCECRLIPAAVAMGTFSSRIGTAMTWPEGRGIDG
jgi:hypothetical protein